MNLGDAAHACGCPRAGQAGRHRRVASADLRRAERAGRRAGGGPDGARARRRGPRRAVDAELSGVHRVVLRLLEAGARRGARQPPPARSGRGVPRRGLRRRSAGPQPRVRRRRGGGRGRPPDRDGRRRLVRRPRRRARRRGRPDPCGGRRRPGLAVLHVGDDRTAQGRRAHPRQPHVRRRLVVRRPVRDPARGRGPALRAAVARRRVPRTHGGGARCGERRAGTVGPRRDPRRDRRAPGHGGLARPHPDPDAARPSRARRRGPVQPRQRHLRRRADVPQRPRRGH